MSPLYEPRDVSHKKHRLNDLLRNRRPPSSRVRLAIIHIEARHYRDRGYLALLMHTLSNQFVNTIPWAESATRHFRENMNYVRTYQM